MKNISAVMMTGMFLVLTIIRGFAQSAPEAKASAINPYRLAITYNKTTSLIFPYAIKSVDKGSRDILAQKAVGVENILQVKSAKMGFAETNLTVVTADGSLFAYILNYADTPVSMSLLFSNPQVAPKPVAVFAKDATTDEVALRAQKAAVRERTVNGISDHNYDIMLDVKGIFIHDEVLYFQLDLKNNSAIDYDVQSIRFAIHDKKRSKRTASQEIEIQPVYITGNKDLIRHSSEQIVCVALPKFTIPDKKYLSVQMMEGNGGRHLLLSIKNKMLIKAKTI